MAVFAYITTPDPETARSIGRKLVEERLAACVNMFPIASIYRWKGKVEEAKETVLIVKTTRERLPEVERRVLELHPYELPCIVWVGVEGHEPFLRWIEEETR